MIADAARLLTKQTGRPVARPTVSRYVNESPRLRALIASIEESVLDLAESRLLRAIEAGHGWAVTFYLNTKGRTRGYVKRNEVVGKDGGAVEVSVKDVSRLTDAELEAIARGE